MCCTTPGSIESDEELSGNFLWLFHGSNQYLASGLFDLILYVLVNNFSVMLGWVILS